MNLICVKKMGILETKYMNIKDKNLLKKHFPKKAQDAKIIYSKLEKMGCMEKFRTAWHLPPNGFLGKQNYYKWREEFLVKATNNFLRSRQYRAMKEEIWKKKLQWAKDKIHFSQIEAWGLKMQLKQPLFKFEYDIEQIMSALKIPNCYQTFVEQSLVLKEMSNLFPVDRDLPRPEFSFDPNTGRKRLFIEVFSDTKIKDFKDKWFQAELKKLQKKVYDYGTIKQLGFPNFEIYEKMYDWHFKEKKSYKEIRKLAKQELGYIIKSNEDVGKDLNRYKKAIGIGTRKKQK